MLQKLLLYNTGITQKKKDGDGMASFINTITKLAVGNKFVKSPSLKALDGVLKSHILIGTKPWGKQPEYLRDYYFGIAKMAENPKIGKISKNLYYF